MPADNTLTGKALTGKALATTEAAVSAGAGAVALEAVEAMYDAHVDVVFAYLARRVGGQLAHDLTADVFRLAIEQFPMYDAGLGSTRSWLLGIATNLVRRHWRTERRRMRAFARAARREPVAGDPVITVDERLVWELADAINGGPGIGTGAGYQPPPGLVPAGIATADIATAAK